MTTTSTTKPKGRRASVPAPDKPASTSPAIDTLTGGDAPRIVIVPLERLHPHPDNPRKDVGDVTELAADIATNGIDQALTVVPDPAHPGDYRVVIGHRRRAATEQAGLTHAPAVIREDLTTAQQRQMMVRENIHRADLTPLEEGDAYQAMLDVDGLTIDQAATAVSRSTTTVRTRLRLSALPEPARAAIHNHTATLEDAAALADITDERLQAELARSLGTSSFRVQLATAQRRQALVARYRRLLDALDAVGASELERNEWQRPDGSVELDLSRRPTTSQEQVDEAIDAVIGDVQPGCSFRWFYDSLVVYRPMTLDEIAAAAQADERRAAIDAERTEAEAAAAGARARRDQLAETTNQTRREFVEHLVHERKALTKDQQLALLEYAASSIVVAPWSDQYIDGVFVGSPHSPDGDEQLAGWLRVEVPDLSEMGYSERGFVLRAPILTAAAELTAPQRLLAGLAAAIEPIASDDWRWGGKAEHIVRWYSLLERLGYTVSDVEREALEPAPEQDA